MMRNRIAAPMLSPQSDESASEGTPQLRSPPSRFFKSALLSPLENVTPNSTWHAKSMLDDSNSSLSATPAYPSPAGTTPFYKRVEGALDDESFGVVVASFRGPLRLPPGNDDELPPTPECADPPQSVKMLRHCSRLGGTAAPRAAATPPATVEPMDDSLGATPQLSSPPACVALLRCAGEPGTPILGLAPAAQAEVPESAFDPKYQHLFESQVLHQQRRVEDEDEDEDQRMQSLPAEESWLVGEAETPHTPAFDEESDLIVRAADRASELQLLLQTQQHARAVLEEEKRRFREAEEARSAATEQERQAQELRDAARRQKEADERVALEQAAVAEATAKKQAAEALARHIAAETAAKKEAEEAIARTARARKEAEEASKQPLTIAPAVVTGPAVVPADNASMAALPFAVAVAAPVAPPAVAAAPRWTPKPEEVRDFSRPPPVASKPVFVARPAAPTPKATAPRAAPAALVPRPVVCVATMEVESVTVELERAVAPVAPVARLQPAAAAQNKARLKIVYSVFIKLNRPLVLEEVVGELSAPEWTLEATAEMLDKLVALKLLQPTGQRWEIK